MVSMMLMMKSTNWLMKSIVISSDLIFFLTSKLYHNAIAIAMTFFYDCVVFYSAEFVDIALAFARFSASSFTIRSFSLPEIL